MSSEDKCFVTTLRQKKSHNHKSRKRPYSNISDYIIDLGRLTLDILIFYCVDKGRDNLRATEFFVRGMKNSSTIGEVGKIP